MEKTGVSEELEEEMDCGSAGGGRLPLLYIGILSPGCRGHFQTRYQGTYLYRQDDCPHHKPTTLTWRVVLQNYGIQSHLDRPCLPATRFSGD